MLPPPQHRINRPANQPAPDPPKEPEDIDAEREEIARQLAEATRRLNENGRTT